MRKVLFVIAMLALAALGARADNIPIILVQSAPSGACTNGQPMQLVIPTGVLYSCQAGTWGVVGAGAGGPPTGSAGGDLSGTYPNPAVAGIKSVPFCTGYTPTNGQSVVLTTASSPNPCYTAVANLPLAGGPSSPMTGAIYNFQDAGGQVVNVLAYGATGAGTMSGSTISGTDDTTAIQAAANAAATSGKPLYLPSPARGHCYRISHIYLDNYSGRNSGWPSQENSFQMYGDGMDVPSNLVGRIFNKTTLCSTATTVPAIQVSVLSLNAAGSYLYGSYFLHDFNVIQVGATAAVPVIGMNQVTQHSYVQRVQVDQVGTGSGLIWKNLWDDSGVSDSTFLTEATTTPTTGTYGLWLYNDDATDSGGGQVIADGNYTGNAPTFTAGFDRNQQIGVISQTSSLAGLATDTIAGTTQQIEAVTMNRTISQHGNYEYVIAGGVYGLDMGEWHGENGLKSGVVLTNGAEDVHIHGGYTYEPSLADTNPAEIYIDCGTGSCAAAPGNGLRIDDNYFGSVAKYMFYSPNAGYEWGKLSLNYAVGVAGGTCFQAYNPHGWFEEGDLCLSFGTLSSQANSAWAYWNPNVSGVYNPTFSGTLKTTLNTQVLTADSSGITATTPGTTEWTWGHLAASTNYSLHCSILFSQATGAGGVGLSVQSATTAATRWDAWAKLYTTNPASTTVTATFGSTLNVTSTTATSIASATPGATGTVYQGELDGTIQTGSTAGTLNVLVYSGSSSDAVTVKAGSFCTVLP